MPQPTQSLRQVVGSLKYTTWVDMLRRLVPDGRTHRLALPLPGGKLHMSYTACLGEEMIRQAGWSAWWQRPFPSTSSTPTDEAVNLRADLPEGGQRFAEGWGGGVFGGNGRFQSEEGTAVFLRRGGCEPVKVKNLHLNSNQKLFTP